MAVTAVAGQNVALIEIAQGYFRGRALCAAARLGIADALGDQERALEQLAEACGADAGALCRLLRALAGFGVVAETRPANFVLTEFGKPLRKDVPDSAWAGVVFWGDLIADDWSHLTECVRTGRKSAEVRPAGTLSRWSQDPDGPSIFRAVMGTAPADDYMPIARAWDFSKFHTVADLGGGGGALIAAVLEAFPGVEGMLVDRPESIDQAAPRFSGNHRCKLIAADLAKEVPAGAAVYMLKHMLHGCDDATAVGILRLCRSVLPKDGRVLVIEFVLPEVVDHAGADLEKRLMADLNMLAVTGGKERSASQWKRLLEDSGLTCEKILPVPGDLVSIVEAASVL